MIETKLHEILSLTRPLLFFDLESTGTEALSDRIVEIGLIQLRPDGTIKIWRTLVNPEIPIPAGATEKHHISDADVQGCQTCKRSKEAHGGGLLPKEPEACEAFKPWPTFAQIADNMLIGFSNTDFGGFNIKTYDLPLMKSEFKRVGKEWDFADAKLVDGFRLWQIAEPRTLSDFVKRWTGEALEGAHQADQDIAGTVRGVEGLLRMVQHLPRRVSELHDLQWPARVRHPSWIDETGKFVVQDGKVVMGFGKHKGIEIKRVPKNYFTFILEKFTDFPPDASQIIRDLLVGKWPEIPAQAPTTQEG